MASGNFFQSENEAVLKSIRPYQIHGARFFEIGFSLPSDPGDSVRRIRVPDNLIYPDARVGDRVKIGILLGNVTHIVKVED
ncbi:MAG: hypothetical protein JSU96_02285 [Acidobacteriota bacterium]|nr:MAG: hypothetical protein JSU96_02285 [Acidobacteriota bacterium]